MRIRKQENINDCGLVILQSLYKNLNGKWLDLSILRNKSFITKEGLNVYSLINLGSKFGIELTSYDVKLDELEPFQEYLVTLIKTENGNHFVFFRLLKKKVEILDPIKGHLFMKIEEFKEIFLDIAIEFQRGEAIQELTENKNDKKWYVYLLKNWEIISSLVVTTLISTIFVFVSSIYMKIIMDQVLPRKLEKELVIISLVFIWVGAMKATNGFFRGYMQRKLNLKIEFELNLIYFESIAKGKLIDLDKIGDSDHIRRISLLEQMASFMSSVFLSIFSDSMMLISSMIILIWINLKLFLIVVLMSGVNLISTIIVHTFIKSKQDKIMDSQLKNVSTSYDFTLSKESLKFTNKRKYLSFSRKKYFEEYKRDEQVIWWYKRIYSLMDTFLTSITPIILTFIGIKLVFNSTISIGELFMFNSLYRSFLGPLDSIGLTILKLPMGVKMLRLIEDVLYIDREELNQKAYSVNDIKSLTFKNVVFSYDKLILDIKDFEIKESIKLKGPNASGKSTFLKCLSTLYDFEGNFKINNFGIDFINKQSFRDKIYYSHPKEFIPSISIIEFITLLDKKSLEIFQNNIKKYSLEKLISSMNIDLSKKLDNNGTNLSSGQLQTVKLLRLLSQNYSLILMDEACENIDNKNLKFLQDAIRDFQNGIFIEVSHNDKYINASKEVNFEQVNKSK